MSERRNAARGSTRTRAVSCRISDANEAPHVAQKSSSIGFLASQTGHGHMGRSGSSGVDGACGGRRPASAATGSVTVGRRGAAAGPSRIGLAARARRRAPARRDRSTCRTTPRLRRATAPQVAQRCSALRGRRIGHAGSVPPSLAGPHEAPLSVGGLPEPARQPRRRSRGQACARSTRARPAAPISRARSGSARSPATASATCSTSPPSTRRPVSPSDDRLARAAGIAHDDRTPARRRLDEDVAPALDLQAPQARAARHREHVAHRVVAREGPPRRPGRRSTTESAGAHRGQRAQLLLVRARRPRSPAPRPGTRRRIAAIPRISTSWPLRATSRLTQTTSGRSADPEALPEVVRRQVGSERGEVGSGVEHRHRHRRRHGGSHGPRDERAAHHRHARGPRRHVTHQRVRARDHREPVVEPVRGRPGTACPARASRGPSVASGNASPNSTTSTSELRDRVRDPSRHAGVGHMNSSGSRRIGTGRPRRTPRRPPTSGASTETRSGGSSFQSASSVRWIPPTRGG